MGKGPTGNIGKMDTRGVYGAVRKKKLKKLAAEKAKRNGNAKNRKK